MKKLYAVYGTLRKGFGNHRLIEGCPLVFEGRVEMPFSMISLHAFPGLVPSSESQSIFIEVYEVANVEVERNLDRLEGYPSFYDKVAITTPVGEANIYFLHRGANENQLVKEGDWVEHLENRRKETHLVNIQ